MSLENLLPPQPEEPLPGDCCGNGCNPCVLDVYQDLLQKWKIECNNIRIGHGTAGSRSVTVLSMTRYMPFQLESVQRSTKDTNIYRFQAVETKPSESLPENVKAIWGRIVCLPGQHLMLRGIADMAEIKLNTEEETVFTRAYTPISDPKDHDTGKFDVMIKLYEKGKMSSFVNRLKVGDITRWRGPYGSFKYHRGRFSSVLMLCGGTGIAPMYSVAKMILNDERDETIVKMMFTCKREEDILLRNELRTLCAFWNFHVDIFLSEDVSGLARYGETLKFARIGKADVEKEVKTLGNVNCAGILICGPTSFTDSMAEIAKACNVPTENVHLF